MKLLLDTHAILWALSADPRLSSQAQDLYENSTELLFSMVSLWEIGIKLGLQRSDFALKELWWKEIPQTLVAQGATRLDIDPQHCHMVSGLPLHHRDPFDRMLIAQAIANDCAILSIDTQLDAYGIQRFW